MHRWHFWSVFCSFLIFLSFFEATFSLAVYKGIFSCCLTEDSGLMLMPNSSFYKTCFLFSSFFHTYNFHGVRVQSSFAYASGGVSFSLFLLLFCSPFLSQLLHHYDFCTISLVLFRTFFLSFFVCSVVLLFSACFLWWSSIFWNFPLHFVSFFSIPFIQLYGWLELCMLYPCTFIAEWSVFVFRVPCPSSGRSCFMSAGKLRFLELNQQWRWEMFPPHAGGGSWGTMSIAIFWLQQLKFSMRSSTWIISGSATVEKWGTISSTWTFRQHSYLTIHMSENCAAWMK